MKVMFVDDESFILSALKRSFFRSKWDIAYANSGPQALEQLENFAADFVVTDMRMPGMNGAELLEKISEQYASTVRIVLSGHADADLSLRASYVAHQWYSKPCDPETLKVEIERINDIRCTLPYEKTQELLGSVKSLPSVPRLFIKLKTLLQESSVTMEDISEAISENPSLTAKVLQVANSSFFVTGSNVTKIEDAIIRLGTDVVCNIVAVAEIYSNVSSELEPYFDDILNRALGTAKLAAKIVDKANKEEAMLAGLLHNIGELVLYQIEPTRIEEYLAKRKVGTDNTVLERSLFQVDSIQVVSYLLHLWHFPYSFIKVINLQNNLDKLVGESFGSALAVHIAKTLQSAQTLDDTLAKRADVVNELEAWQAMVEE